MRLEFEKGLEQIHGTVYNSYGICFFTRRTGLEMEACE